MSFITKVIDSVKKIFYNNIKYIFWVCCIFMNNFGYIISKSFVSVNIKIKFRNFAQKERRFIMYNIQTVNFIIQMSDRTGAFALAKIAFNQNMIFLTDL